MMSGSSCQEPFRSKSSGLSGKCHTNLEALATASWAQDDAGIERCGERLNNRKPKAAAGPALIPVQSIEAGKHFVVLRLWNAGTVILHFDHVQLRFIEQANGDIAPACVVADRVVEEIGDDFGDHDGIG